MSNGSKPAYYLHECFSAMQRCEDVVCSENESMIIFKSLHHATSSDVCRAGAPLSRGWVPYKAAREGGVKKKGSQPRTFLQPSVCKFLHTSVCTRGQSCTRTDLNLTILDTRIVRMQSTFSSKPCLGFFLPPSSSTPLSAPRSFLPSSKF